MPPASPIACLAAALLIAGGAKAQPTPETPGAAGAEAAVAALADAQRAQDWPAIVHLLSLDATAEVAAALRDLGARSRAVGSDSAAFVASDRFRRDFNSNPRVFRMAQRIGSVLPPGETLSDEALVLRVLTAAMSRNPARYALLLDPPAVRIVGSVAEGDSLTHVVVRVAERDWATNTLDETVGLMPMRWAGSRWTTAYRRLPADSAFGEIDRVMSNWAEVLGDVLNDLDDLPTGAMEDGDDE